jgi:transposase
MLKRKIEIEAKSGICPDSKFTFMSFHEIDDVLWKSIEPYLPPQKSHTGRPRADMSKLINGILYVVMTGCTWKDVPRRYGSKCPQRNNLCNTQLCLK